MTLEDIAKSDPVVNNIAQIIVSIRHKWCRVIYIADLTQWYKAFVVVMFYIQECFLII